MIDKETAQKYYDNKISLLNSLAGRKDKVRVQRELRKMEKRYATQLSDLADPETGRLPYTQAFVDANDPKKNKYRKLKVR